MRPSYRNVPFLLLAGGLGCAAPRYSPPEPVKPAGPLSLEAAVDLGLRNNPDVAAAGARVAAARAAIDEAYSYYWPVLQLMERFTHTDAPSRAFGNVLDQRRVEDVLAPGKPGFGFDDPGAVTNFRAGLSGSITLYDGGRRLARVLAAQARAGSMEALRDTVRRDIAFETARSYFLIHKARETAATEEQSIATLETHLKITEARLAEGAARRSDALAVRVRLAETREAAIVSTNSALRAEAGLRMLLGLGLEVPLEVLPPPRAEVPRRPALASLLARARAKRPELRRAQMEVEAAAAKVREAHAGYFPEVTVFGDFGFDGRGPALDKGNWFWGVSFIESLFDALRTPSRVRRAMAELAEVHAAGRKAVLQVELDVRDALLDAEEADARTEVASQAAGLAEESLRLVEAEYREGKAGITRLLESELALTLARTRLSASSYDRTLSRIAVAHAAGEYPRPPGPADGAAIQETPP